MDGADASRHFDSEEKSLEQAPSLLTIILDTHPAAWALIQDVLPLSSVISSLLVFINAHLASNYTNQVAVIASHCDKAQWLYPTPQSQDRLVSASDTHHHDLDDEDDGDEDDDIPAVRNKRARTNGSTHTASGDTTASLPADSTTSYYRPFQLISQALIANLNQLLSTTTPDGINSMTSTKIAGALSLALSYIHRLTQERRESLIGRDTAPDDSTTSAIGTGGSDSSMTILQSRILLVSLSPSADLAHQYIPIMNSIFACQRQGIPIDVLQLPLSSSSDDSTNPSISPESPSHSSTVFLQQAADATHGIFIPAHLTPASPSHDTTTTSTTLESRQKTAQQSLLTYLLTAFSSSPLTRTSLILPTKIDVDFRAACFCHRNVISTGFVCSICLSIFCEESVGTLAEQGCLTCGTTLNVREEGVGGFGRKPVVVAAPAKRKKKTVRVNELGRG